MDKWKDIDDCRAAFATEKYKVCILEPLMLEIGNEYNLNNVKEIKVTNDFLTLDKTITHCQNKESFEDCKTRKYADAIVHQCRCLPFAIGNDSEVCIAHFQNYYLFYSGMIIGLGCMCHQWTKEMLKKSEIRLLWMLW